MTSTDNEQQYWFAQRYPVGDARKGVAPVSRRAHSIVWVTVIAAILAIVILSMMIANGLWWFGVIVAAAIVGGTIYAFIRTRRERTDPTHTVADYKAGTVPGQRPYMEP